VEKGVVLMASNIKDATSTVIDATAATVVGAAKMTPGLNIILRTSVHWLVLNIELIFSF